MIFCIHADIDECTERRHTCAHNCHNGIGNYSCSCNIGFELNVNGRGCSKIPEFIHPTIPQNSCVAIPYNTTFETTLTVSSGDVNSTIVDVQILNEPIGLRIGEMHHINGTNIYYINVTWDPDIRQQNDTVPFCFRAINSKGLASEEYCIRLLTGHSPPVPVQATATPHQQLVLPTNTTWRIMFNMDIERPSMTASITFHEFLSENVVYSIDTSSSQEVRVEGSNELYITPSYIFNERSVFYINFGRGVVQGLQGCRPGNEPLDDKEFWTFEVMDVTPPSITLLQNPSVSNNNVTISWYSNENVTWECILVVEDSSQSSVNCSDAHWTGYNLGEGLYTLQINGTDDAGNMATAMHEFYIDATPPVLTITQNPAQISNQRAPIITFRCNEACSLECQFLSNAMSQQLPFPCNTGSFAPHSLQHNNSYIFKVTATDRVGNTGLTSSYMWETDFESPQIYGLQNITAQCTDISPETIGQVQAVDDRTSVPSLRYHDIDNGCSVRRTWTATDSAGNSASFFQTIHLEYAPTISLLSPIVFQCDSTLGTVEIPTSTASAPNPCRLPLLLTHEDPARELACPGNFVRNWTVNICNNTSSMQQSIVLYDLCPPYACGRNESIPRGICSYGSCQCNRPWYGGDCSELIHQPAVEPVNDTVIQEAQAYSTTITVIQGTPPLMWTLISGPDRLRVDPFTGQVAWARAQAGNYTISIQIENRVGRVQVSWSLQVLNGYNAFLNPVTPTLYPRSQAITLLGYVEYIEDSFVERFLARIVPVYIDITTGGTTRTVRTFTSRNGSFYGTFYPAATEYGSYMAGARHPGLPQSPTQAQWGFLGMSATPSTISLYGESVDSFEQTFYNATVICNDGPAPLNGLTATPVLSDSGHLGVMIALTGAPSNSTLEPGDKVLMDISVRASRPLYGLFIIMMQTHEGTTLRITANLRIEPILPTLSVFPPSVNTRIVRGRSRTFEFNITNTGRTIARNVQSRLPNTNFISLISFGNMQQSDGNFSLESGQSAVLSILAQTPESQELGEISLRIVVASEEVSVSIPVVLLVSSDVFMNLTVIVEDEYTYFASGQPLVNDATITLINYQRNLRIARTTELGNGTATFFDIFEDRYEMYVEAPDHLTLRQVIITSIDEPVVTVFIQREAVRYTWTVTPVQIEDTYTVTIEADFETQVPIPVVTVSPTVIDLDELELGLVTSFQLNITNHGLIRADDVSMQLPDNHPFLMFTTNNEQLGDLEALSSVIVVVQTSRRSIEKRIAQFYSCNVLHITFVYSYICGTRQLRSFYLTLQPSSLSRGQVSCTRPPRPPRPTDTPSTGIIPTSGRGDPSSAITTYTARTPLTCDDCLFAILLSCITIPLPPVYGCIPLILFGDITDAASWVQCLLGLNWLGAYLCLKDVLGDCFDLPILPGRKKRALERAVGEYAEGIYPIVQSIELGIEVLGDDVWISNVEDPMWLSRVLRPALDDASELGSYISSTEQSNILAAPPPNGTTSEIVARMVERLNNTMAGWNSGQLEPQEGDNMASYSAFQEYNRNIQTYNNLARSKGFESYLDAYSFARNEVIQNQDMDGEEGVCAVVRIRIEQELAITREAFLARLEIENQESSPLEQIGLEIIITDAETGEQATHLFSIGSETLSGALSDSNMGWSLPSEMTGSAEWLIIPYSEAALESDHVYDVGGTLRYSSDGSNITVPLLPAVITVRPDPSLLVHYFWERYVVGDDPFTDEVEPSVPFTLGVAVKNAGHGTAYSLRITSGQPEIIENERGLLISFRIIGANIGSEAINPSLTVTFGDLTPNTTKVARWFMISSLQGEFMNYSATFENINPLGDPRLSLLDQLEIHELIRNVMIYSDPSENDEVLDFLVNERDDFLAYPDILYSSKTLQSYNVSAGTILSVRTISGIPTLLEVRSFSNSTGWIYYRFEDTQGLLSETASAVNITKYENSMTTSIPPENSWITRESYRGARRATDNLYLHIVDSVGTAGEVVFVADLCRVDCSRATTTSATPTQAATDSSTTPATSTQAATLITSATDSTTPRPATSTQAATMITSTTDSTTPTTPTQGATTTTSSTTDSTTPATSTTSTSELATPATSTQEAATISTSSTDSTAPTQITTVTTLSTTEIPDAATADIQTSPDATTLTTGQPTTATSLSTSNTADAETTSVDIQTPTDFTTPTLTTTVTADSDDTSPPSTADLATTSTDSPQSTLAGTTTATTDAMDVPTSTGMPAIVTINM